MSEEEARALEAERLKPMPPSGPRKPLDRVTENVLRYAEGSLLDPEDVTRAMIDLCAKFKTRNWVKALADYGEALAQRKAKRS